MEFEKYTCEICGKEFASWPGWPAICFDCRQYVPLHFPPSRADRKTLQKVGYWLGLSRWVGVT